MKLNLSSVCPLLFVGVASPVLMAAEGPTEGFLSAATLTLNQRNFYFHRNLLNNPGGQNYREEWAHGFMLDFASGYTPGTVKFGVDAYAQLGLKLDSGRGRSGTNLMPVDSDGRAEDDFSEAGAALKAKVSDTELKYGSLTPMNPVFGTGNARLFTSTATGFQLTSREIDDLTLDAGHFTAGSAGSSTSADGPLTALYTYGVETRAADYLGAAYAGGNGTSLSFYASRFEDIWKQYYANLGHVFQLSRQDTLGLDFNIYRTTEEGGQKAGAIDNTTWSLSSRYSHGPHSLTLAYQRVHGDEPFDYLGFGFEPGTSIWLANSVQIVDFNAPNERSWQLRYDLDMAAFGVPGLSFMSRYVSGDQIDDSHYDGGPNGGQGAYGNYGTGGKRWERDIELRYVVQGGPAKDLSVRLRQATLRSSAQVAAIDTADNNEIRVILDYPLSLL